MFFQSKCKSSGLKTNKCKYVHEDNKNHRLHMFMKYDPPHVSQKEIWTLLNKKYGEKYARQLWMIEKSTVYDTNIGIRCVVVYKVH